VSEVIRYEGEITLEGQVSDFQGIIDPQTWHQNFPFIWLASYLIDGDLPPDRDTPPPRLPTVTTNPRGGMLFEQVLFGPIIYSNVINTQLELHPNGGSPELLFEYSQVDCRTTKFLLTDETIDGGIDVDSGVALCAAADQPGFVTITITKAVRFTEPTPFVDLMQPLFEAVVKMTLDALLQSLIFVGP